MCGAVVNITPSLIAPAANATDDTETSNDTAKGVPEMTEGVHAAGHENVFVSVKVVNDGAEHTQYVVVVTSATRLGELPGEL